MITGSTTNEKQNASGQDSIKRTPLPQDEYRSCQYDKMNDESKQTEDGDISRFEYADTLQQETNRNLKGASNIDISTTHTLDQMRNSSDNKDYKENFGQEKRGNSKNKNKFQKNQVYSNEDEEQKSQDCIGKDLYGEDFNNLKKNQKNYQHFNTEGNVEDIEDNQVQDSNFNKQQSKAKFAAYQLKPQLPQVKLNIPLTVSGNDVFEIFTSICKSQRFQVIEMDQNIATAINKEPFSIRKIFQRCFPFHDSKRENTNESQISAIRLQIAVNEIKCCRKITLKGLYGEHNKLQEFLTVFKNKLHDQVSSSKISMSSKESEIEMSNKHDKNTSSKTENTVGNYGGRRISSDEDSDNEGLNGAYTETSSIYQINKILSSDQYTLGRNVAQYIECFHLQYKSLRESSALLPQPMEGIMALIHETVQSFNSEYNLGKQTAKGLMHFCRPSVEKYLYQKLYDKLFAMYAIKNEDEDRLFIDRSSLIKRQKSHDVMRYLGIKDQFIIGENQPHSQKFEDHIKDLATQSHYDSQRSDHNFNNVNNEHNFNNTSSSSNMGGLSQLNKNDLPYIEAIKCIEKIQQFQSPREKLQCISEAFGSLKTTIVDHWKGKLELNAMDDVLPLTIYVVAMSELSHPQSEFNIMEDYLQLYDKGFEFERKLLTNFDVSIRYVNHEWEIENN